MDVRYSKWSLIKQKRDIRAAISVARLPRYRAVAGRLFSEILDRFKKHLVKDHACERGNDRGCPMMGAHAREAGREGDDAEEAEQDNDSVETGALPVAAAEVQPHLEFIEGERHARCRKAARRAAAGDHSAGP